MVHTVVGQVTPPPPERAVSWKQLIPNIVQDQKRVWLFPLRVTHNHDWIPTAAVVGATATLIALDAHDTPFFRRTSTFAGFNKALSSGNTSIAMVLAPTALYVAGFLRKDRKAQHTALLAGEAVADAEILATVLKGATRRVRPSGIPPGGPFNDTWFEQSGSVLRARSSFPSGHSIAAFSIATVIARRYPTRRWVPFAAYGAASLIGFSRLTRSAHFPSDVFVGGALGYSIGRFAVLQP